jgi:hypothetical protein
VVLTEERQAETLPPSNQVPKEPCIPRQQEHNRKRLLGVVSCPYPAARTTKHGRPSPAVPSKSAQVTHYLSSSCTKCMRVPARCMTAVGSIKILTPLDSTSSSNFPFVSGHAESGAFLQRVDDSPAIRVVIEKTDSGSQILTLVQIILPTGWLVIAHLHNSVCSSTRCSRAS